jgi:succinoglycan biosynthesis protein ExoA
LTGPQVSIIVPCYNEEQHIRGLLDAILAQNFSVSQMEVIIADGMSTDKTRETIRDFAKVHQQLAIRLIDNPKRNIPSGLNLAIRASEGAYIVRLDAHSVPEKYYIKTCVDHLKAGKAQNIGGIWLIQPGSETAIAKAIATAAAHPLGVGGAQYRNPKAAAGYVDTVPFGSYRKDFLVDIGLFDETLLSNEDYELNTRIRERGGKIYLDPAIRCTYYARHNLKALSKQYYRYGFWKYQMLKRYPESLLLRQFLPPVLVFALLLLLILGFFIPLFVLIFGFVFLLYFFSIFVGTYLVSKSDKYSFNLHFLMSIAISTMHLSWGFGFLFSPIFAKFRK